MPTVTYLKNMFQAQIAPGNDYEFLRLLTEADMRLLEFCRHRWTRRTDTLTPVDGFITLPTTYASILGARIGKDAVDIRDEDYEFVPGGPGEVQLGNGFSRLIDQGFFDTEVILSSYLLVNGTGPFTDGSGDPTTIDGLQFFERDPINGRKAYWLYSTPPGVIIGTYTVIRWTGSQWEMKTGFPTGGYYYRVYSSEDVATPDLVTSWILDTSGDYALATGTVDSITLEQTSTTIQQRKYKVAGHLDEDDIITALMHFAPVTLTDPDIEDAEVPADATVNTRCPDATALKLMMLGILMEEAHDQTAARTYISDALRNLDNKEQAQRGNAAKTILNRSSGRGVLRIRGWR